MFLFAKDGNSALMFAAFSNHALCANELLKAGADVTLENSNLDTVFSISIKKQSKQGMDWMIYYHFGSNEWTLIAFSNFQFK